ncbi:unnamed protein product [Brassica rapa subsp. trilocularis]
MQDFTVRLSNRHKLSSPSLTSKFGTDYRASGNQT